MDGVGELVTTSIVLVRDNKIETFKEINFPHSLGLFYASFTDF